jgi:hypothetical protein
LVKLSVCCTCHVHGASGALCSPASLGLINPYVGPCLDRTGYGHERCPFGYVYISSP